MGFLNVAGAPLAPSGKTIQIAYLTVILQTDFQDSVNSYPHYHYGQWEVGDASWRAEGSSVGANVPFKIPGKGITETTLSPPPVCVIEHHIYTDGEEQIFRRYTTISDNGIGNWNYASP